MQSHLGILLFYALIAPTGKVADEELRLEERVNLSIDRGVAYLRTQERRLEMGAFDPDYPGGANSLTYYTLLMCGVPVDDPLLVNLERRVLASAREVSHTYTLSLALLGLLAGNRDDHGATIALLIARLEAGQLKQSGEGAWGYTLPDGRTTEGGRRRHAVAHWAAPDGWWDNSNSQYAILALRSAVDFGYAVDPRVFERAVEHFLGEQKGDGGFAYSASHRVQSYSSMTAGVAGSLVMCGDVLEEGPSTQTLRKRIQLRLPRTISWLGRELRFPCEDSPWPFYAAYAVERFGHYAQLGQFGNLEWYQAGATWLVTTQTEEGFWSVAPALARTRARGPRAKRRPTVPQVVATGQSLSNTCYALLFLRRSSSVHTRMSDEVAVLLRGIDRQARRSDLETIKRRILSAGRRAVPQLVRGLYLPSEPALELADECLRELTGEDVGYQHAKDEHERRRAREAWVRFLLNHEDYGKLGS